ncbi:sulfatase-like hydrolase/transferase [Fluviibacterium sp. DFM31]|uniref:Sulfatase-like hydrolase/transferase n=1 Tax=Meridianimarinicoccus marinus TaxID=3231483 RepID=A0ABV3LBQ7_9RHOB
MKTVFVLFDSLNAEALQPYGSRSIRTPNFARFAQRAVTFDNHYVGSLPCMPARRDMHTGRLFDQALGLRVLSLPIWMR